MTLYKANKILKDNQIIYINYFDLMGIQTKDLQVMRAIERIKTFLIHGK